jgi:pseudouridine-5'-phosphate glycosidase
MNDLPPFVILSGEVQSALEQGSPVVALESTVITHGLPHPQNLNLAREMESLVRSHRATPATIAVLDGMVRVGLKEGQLERLSQEKDLLKISTRDFAPAIAGKASGGTTVAGTLLIAKQVGIRVFATGGIGGVHQGNGQDVSADLPQLAASPVVVICAGAKAILDLPGTIEYLETLGVPVIGYDTGEFPAFYSRESGLPVSVTVNAPNQIALITETHWAMGGGGLLVVNPIDEEFALSKAEIDKHIVTALKEAEDQEISGQAVTPFLLERVAKLSGGKSMAANLALLKSNAILAAEIAQFITP